MGKVWDNIKGHKITFFLGLLPLILALAVYLYMDFSDKVTPVLDDYSTAIFSIAVIFAVVGIIFILTGPKLDNYLAERKKYR